MEVKNVTITISGPAGSGKSTLAVIIARALEEAGIEVALPLRPDLQDRRLKALDGLLSVTLVEQQTRRTGPTPHVRQD